MSCARRDDRPRTAFVANTDAGTEALWSVRFDDPVELRCAEFGRTAAAARRPFVVQFAEAAPAFALLAIRPM